MPCPPDQSRETKVSAVAIAALVLGVLSVLGGLTGLPAIVLGIIGLMIIGTSGGRVTGKGYAIIGIVVPLVVFALMLGFVVPRFRGTAYRMTCGTNLSGIGKAMMVYANDYDDKLPRAGGSNPTWGRTVWAAATRAFAYNDNGTRSEASISSCFYLLVKYAGMTPSRLYARAITGRPSSGCRKNLFPFVSILSTPGILAPNRPSTAAIRIICRSRALP